MIDKELEPGNLRGLMEFDYPEKGYSIEKVESAGSSLNVSRQELCLRIYF